LRTGKREDVFFENETLYEAHRLASSDMAFVCGPDESWMASFDDLSLESACARAVGLQPGILPCLKFIAKHEIVSYEAEPGFNTPDWTGIAGSRFSVWLTGLYIKLGKIFISTTTDLHLIQQNWWRVSRYLEREMKRYYAR
jgi:hypothetical protein